MRVRRDTADGESMIIGDFVRLEQWDKRVMVKVTAIGEKKFLGIRFIDGVPKISRTEERFNLFKTWEVLLKKTSTKVKK